jgi:hypothetical protein
LAQILAGYRRRVSRETRHDTCRAAMKQEDKGPVGWRPGPERDRRQRIG